jgi:sugar transferase (PEP-CTERM/EpsH1 system associated)
VGADPTGRKLRLLLLTPKPPFPPIDGGRIAVYEPLRRLAARGHRITLLTFRPPGQDEASLAGLAPLCRVASVPHDTRTRPLGLIRNLFSPLPYNVAKYHSPHMVQKLREALASEAFDVVHLEQVHMAGYHTITKGECGIPTVLRQENIESHLAERYWRTQSGLRRAYARLLAARLRRYEAAVCANMDRCLAITAEDAGRLRDLSPRARTVVIPAGVDIEAFRPSPQSEQSDTVVFVGSMDWPPNADAVVWFCQEVLPPIRHAFPAVQFYVVGKDPSPAVLRLAERDTIHITGFVEDVRDYLAQAATFVVPLRVGGGMRLKLLQALAMAKPAVSTTIGAEGIAVAHGRNILLADSAADFAKCVIDLLGNRELRVRLGANGRQLVEENYSWEAATDLLEAAYRDVMR